MTAYGEIQLLFLASVFKQSLAVKIKCTVGHENSGSRALTVFARLTLNLRSVCYFCVHIHPVSL